MDPSAVPSINQLSQPQYEGEDLRPTSSKELAGWYSYGWAAEVFTICAMASFLPITLEQLARDQGVLLRDKSKPCPSSWDVSTVPEDGKLSAVESDSPSNKPREHSTCVVYIAGLEVNTASFAMYTFSVSVLIQALIIISMSGAADHGRSRKRFLLGFAVTGAVSTILFLPVVPGLYLFGALLAVIANTSFGASFVLLNSFLPLLVRYHPQTRRAQQLATTSLSEQEQRISSNSIDTSRQANDGHQTTTADSHPTTTLLDEYPDRTAPTKQSPAASSVELRLSTQISSRGIGIGYVAGLFVQSAAILLVRSTGSTTFSLRLVLFIVGAWWLVFTIPAALWLRPRPGPPLPSIHQTWFSYLVYSWRSLYLTIVRARRLKDVGLFLAAWFLLSDGIATVSGTAILFAKTTLGMKPWALALINVISTIAGVFGAFAWSHFSRLWNLRASQTIMACICLFEVIPLYGLLGFLPFIRHLGVFGLQAPWEMYPLGAIYGFVLGGLSSYCRSFFGELIPPGSEAAFYALYAITDKGSSIFGPAVVGAITDRYGEIRPAFLFLAILIALPLPLMSFVNVERGKKDAMDLAKIFEANKLNARHESSSRYHAVPTSVPSQEDDGQ